MDDRCRMAAPRSFNFLSADKAYANLFLVFDNPNASPKQNLESGDEKHSARKHSTGKHSVVKHSSEKCSAGKHCAEKHSAEKHSSEKQSAAKHSGLLSRVANNFLPSAGMIFLSDEDVDVKRLLARWIKTQPEGLRGGLSGWVDDMFYRSNFVFFFTGSLSLKYVHVISRGDIEADFQCVSRVSWGPKLQGP